MIFRILLKTILIDKAIHAFFDKLIFNFSDKKLMKIPTTELEKGMYFKTITHTLSNTTYHKCVVNELITYSEYNGKTVEAYFRYSDITGDTNFAYDLTGKVEVIYEDEVDCWIYEP